MPTIKDALDIIGKLTVAEQESLKTMLLSTAFVKSLNIEDFVAKERFANGRVCPLCGCIHVVRNGHRKDGTQRYVCKDCGKSFVIATNSIVSGTRKDLSVWEQYIDCMMNGLSIRKTAVACGIHRNTAFLWRHKILDALQNMADDVTLNGIIETDETFFAISYKGNHSKSKTFTMPRKAHKRGHSTHIRGLSQEKVCVPCAVNRNGFSISKITNTGRVSTKDLHHIYDGRIKTNSTLVTDKMNSYVRFTNANGIDLVQLKTGKAKKGIYNIQHINSYHSQLKRFMRGFNGVSTKYLNNYLVWNNLVNYAKESDMEKRNIFLTFVLATLKTAKCRDLSNEAEVVFKLMLGNLMKTTRVHSTQALEGLLFTTFVALSILTNLRARMKADLNGQPVCSSYTIAEVFARLKKIQLIEIEGKKYLINVSSKDKKLVEALGFGGLYDSPEAALKPLLRLE